MTSTERSEYGPWPQELRANITFAFTLAEGYGITVQGINGDEWGNVQIYAWETGYPRIAQIADLEGWPPEVRSGRGWQSRERAFDVGGRRVRIQLVGDDTPVPE